MKVLVFTNEVEDYLADSILYGLLMNPNLEVFQVPIKKILYRSYKGQFNIRGNGFTLYHLLEDEHLEDRIQVQHERINISRYDLIVFSSIQRQFKHYQYYYKDLVGKKVWIIDGEDTPGMYPFHGYYWRRPSYWFLPRAHNRFPYFKREWTPKTIQYLYYKIVPGCMIKFLPRPKNLKAISFTIPEAKIIKHLPKKVKLFTKHIVDKEVADNVSGSFIQYAFETEDEYYKDIQGSRFGVSTKRSGWDCLRHYEIAANGAVICFRNLDKKPLTCAPHGLVDGRNCLSYTNYDHLMIKINSLSEDQYVEIQKKSMEWVNFYSCEAMVSRLLIEENLSG